MRISRLTATIVQSLPPGGLEIASTTDGRKYGFCARAPLACRGRPLFGSPCQWATPAEAIRQGRRAAQRIRALDVAADEPEFRL